MACLKELEAIDNNNNEQLVNLYVYRKYRFVGSGALAYFFINNSYYCDLKCNQYFVKKVRPGNHLVKVSYNIPEVGHIEFYDQKTINIENGCKDYFIEIHYGEENTISVATKEIAEKEMNAMALTETMQKKIFE